MIVDCAVYENGKRRNGEVDLHEAFEACRRSHGHAFAWIGLYEPTPEEFDSVTREFHFHELAVEDAIKAHQRPKLEMYGDTVLLVLKTARYVDSHEVVKLGEILVFIGEGFIVTVRHGSAGELSAVRAEIEANPERLQHGTGAVLHAIVDHVVDEYSPAIEGLEEDVDQVEEQVFSTQRATGNVSQRIYQLKREVLEFIRATAPLVEPVRKLAEGKHELVHPEVRTYFRDVNDHLIRAHEQLEGFRDLLTSVLEANLTQVGVRQNEDMRKISAWVAIAAVPTMIAGIYGMNFEHMPELGWTYGYPLILAVMLVACGALFRGFKRAGWL
jgi:magnesium transporter